LIARGGARKIAPAAARAAMSAPDRQAALEQYRRRAAVYDLELALFEPLRRAAVARLALQRGETVLDCGCGTGLSLPLLRAAVGAPGRVVGIEQSPEMLAQARRLDPAGVELRRAGREFTGIAAGSVDLILCAFTFDNIPGWERKVALFTAMRAALRPWGRIINLVSSPTLYEHEWASFSTKDFPGNRGARTGDIVRTVILDTDDHRPVDDVFWSEADYEEVYRRAGLAVQRLHRPLGTAADPCTWVNEERLSPWNVYVLVSA